MLKASVISNPFGWGSPFSPMLFCANPFSKVGAFFVLNVGQRCVPQNQASLNPQSSLNKKKVNLRLKNKKAAPFGAALPTWFFLYVSEN